MDVPYASPSIRKATILRWSCLILILVSLAPWHRKKAPLKMSVVSTVVIIRFHLLSFRLIFKGRFDRKEEPFQRVSALREASRVINQASAKIPVDDLFSCPKPPSQKTCQAKISEVFKKINGNFRLDLLITQQLPFVNKNIIINP